MLRFCVHHSNSAFTWVERLTFAPQEFWVINPWICWCWKDRYWRTARKTATDVEDNLPVSLLNSLAATFSQFKKFPHYACNFYIFSLGRLNVIFRESALHETAYFLFPNLLKRSCFQKIHTGIWSFLYYQER